jgi:hypothetical protein
MHVELTPIVAPQEMQRALLELAKDIRAVVSGDTANQLDMGCRITAAGIILTRAGQLKDSGFAACPCPTGEDAAKLLSASASSCTDDGTMKAIDWKTILQLILMLLDQWLNPKL